jgi:hypothetical protein
MKKVLLAISLVLVSSTAFAFGLSSVMGGGGGSSTGLSADQIQDQFSNVSKDYNAATKSFLLSASTALEAFNSKSQAATLKAEAEQIGTGTVSSDDVDKRSEMLKNANADITAKMKSGEKLSKAGQAKLVESMGHMAKGAAIEVPLIATVANLTKQTADSMKSVSITQIAKVKTTASVLSALSTSLPKDLGLAKDTMGHYVDYAKANGITVPNDVTNVFASK